jgi:hypothetical protein
VIDNQCLLSRWINYREVVGNLSLFNKPLFIKFKCISLSSQAEVGESAWSLGFVLGLSLRQWGQFTFCGHDLADFFRGFDSSGGDLFGTWVSSQPIRYAGATWRVFCSWNASGAKGTLNRGYRHPRQDVIHLVRQGEREVKREVYP